MTQAELLSEPVPGACPSCGRELSPWDARCAGCGADRPAPPATIPGVHPTDAPVPVALPETVASPVHQGPAGWGAGGAGPFAPETGLSAQPTPLAAPASMPSTPQPGYPAQPPSPVPGSFAAGPVAAPAGYPGYPPQTAYPAVAGHAAYPAPGGYPGYAAQPGYGGYPGYAPYGGQYPAPQPYGYGGYPAPQGYGYGAYPGWGAPGYGGYAYPFAMAYPAPPRHPLPVQAWIAIGGAATVIIGTFGDWGHRFESSAYFGSGSYSVTGLSTGTGLLLFFGAIGAIALAANSGRPWRRAKLAIATMALAGAGLLACILSLALNGPSTDAYGTTTSGSGWGPVCAGVGCALVLGAAAWQWVEARSAVKASTMAGQAPATAEASRPIGT